MAKIDRRNVPSSAPGPAVSDRSAAGHCLLAHTADCIIEAWGPDRSSCLVQALLGLVESFAEVPDVPATRLVPFAVAPEGPEDTLISLFEDVIYALDVFSVVPVRFHSLRPRVAGSPETWMWSRPTRSKSSDRCPRLSRTTSCR
jgi:archease protein family (MTH1598/TM1083)